LVLEEREEQPVPLVGVVLMAVLAGLLLTTARAAAVVVDRLRKMVVRLLLVEKADRVAVRLLLELLPMGDRVLLV
jgi:hypothetical protein